MADRLLLVVEGPDDKHVFWAILARHRFEPRFLIRDEGGFESLPRSSITAATMLRLFLIRDEGGFESLLARLPVHLKPGTDLGRFGVVVDADADIKVRWQQMKRILERAGYGNIPDAPDLMGTIIDHEDLPRVGVWIMPDNTLPGMLEDYLSYLVPEGDALFDRAKRCVREIRVEERRFIESHFTKALIHTWLAWQDDPGAPFGQAVSKRYFDSSGPHVQGFLDWLTRLFA